jgi:hypothetical protein
MNIQYLWPSGRHPVIFVDMLCGMNSPSLSPRFPPWSHIPSTRAATALNCVSMTSKTLQPYVRDRRIFLNSSGCGFSGVFSSVASHGVSIRSIPLLEYIQSMFELCTTPTSNHCYILEMHWPGCPSYHETGGAKNKQSSKRLIFGGKSSTELLVAKLL